MVRRLQLMEPERRGLGARVTEAAARLRDGLLRDNKVLPPVLAALALIIFAWLLAGVIIGEPDGGQRVARQAAQPSVAQAPDDGSGPSDTPAPGVENRDNESLDVYESKDPFRELLPPADPGGETSGDSTGSRTADPGNGSGGGGSDGTGTGSGSDSGGSGSDQYGSNGGNGSLNQAPPGDPGFGDGSGNGSGSGSGSGGGFGNGGGSGNDGSSGNGSGSGNGSAGGSGSGGGSGNGTGQYGGRSGGGNGDLFDSGGDLRR